MDLQTNNVSTSSTVVEQLKAEAKRDQVFSNVCHVFAARERARQQVTLEALWYNMQKHGFKHTKEQYEAVLKFLASRGIGHIERDSKNRIIALKGVKYTLQSIGRAALGERPSLDKNTVRASYKDIQPMPQAFVDKSPTTRRADPYKIVVTLVINDKPVVLEVPSKIAPDELNKFINAIVGGKG